MVAAETESAWEKKVFLPWKFSNAESLIQVEDGLACLATLPVTVKTGSLSQESSKEEKPETGGNWGCPLCARHLVGLSDLFNPPNNHIKCETCEFPFLAQWVKNPASIHEDAGSIPGPGQWV